MLVAEYIAIHELTSMTKKNAKPNRRRVQTNKYCWLSGDPTKCPPGHGASALVAAPAARLSSMTTASAPAPSPSNSTTNGTSTIGGGAVRRRVESTVKDNEDTACEPAQRQAYEAIMGESSLTHTCRDYLARHAPEWTCQYDN
jgi:hypothetical protein